MLKVFGSEAEQNAYRHVLDAMGDGGLADPAGMLNDALRVRERGIRIAEQPQRDRAVAPDRDRNVHGKSRRQRRVLDGIIKCDRPIQGLPAFRDVAREQQGNAHDAMPVHQRHGRVLL